MYIPLFHEIVALLEQSQLFQDIPYKYKYRVKQPQCH